MDSYAHLPPFQEGDLYDNILALQAQNHVLQEKINALEDEAVLQKAKIMQYEKVFTKSHVTCTKMAAINSVHKFSFRFPKLNLTTDEQHATNRLANMYGGEEYLLGIEAATILGFGDTQKLFNSLAMRQIKISTEQDIKLIGKLASRNLANIQHKHIYIVPYASLKGAINDMTGFRITRKKKDSTKRTRNNSASSEGEAADAQLSPSQHTLALMGASFGEPSSSTFDY